jgi:hypothetical protein
VGGGGEEESVCVCHTGSGPVPQGAPKHTHIIEVGYSIKPDINMQDKEVLKGSSKVHQTSRN